MAQEAAPDPAGRAARAPARRWSHYWVLATSLVLTLAGTWAVSRAVHERDRARFANAVDTARDRIQNRIDAYAGMLLGARSLFSTGHPTTLHEFRRYVASLEARRRYPGIQGIGFSQRLSVSARERVEAELRAQGHEGFRVWPDEREQPRDELHAIVFLEPLDRRNRAAIGYDMFSEPVRREAMARARDDGAPAASGRVTLVQEIDEVKQAGFLIYVPVYAGPAPATVAGRREALVGFVYSPFRADDLFAGIFGTEREPRVGFAVYDGASPDPRALMHRSEGEPARRAPRMSAREQITVAGRTWTLAFHSRPVFEAVSSRHLVPVSLGIGLLTSVVLFLVARAQVRARAEAEVARAEAEVARAEAEGQRNHLGALADDLRRLTDDLQAAVRVRDEFLSIAGHELRTPLAALSLQIQGLLRQHDRGAFGGATGRLPERLGKTVGHVGRLERLVGELLDVSRIASGRLRLHLEDVDLAALARELVDRFADAAARAGCELALDAPEPVVGRWDRLRLDQVLTNLMSNAIKYGRGRPVDLHVRGDGGRARIVVRDRGIGVAPEDRERIFGRFERAVSEHHYGGLGLGLWISRQIVDDLGGAIVLDSAPGQGATFTVELPYAPPALPAAERSGPDAAAPDPEPAGPAPVAVAAAGSQVRP